MADAIWGLLSFLFPQDELWGKLRGSGTKLVSSFLSTICSALKEEMSLVNELDEELDKLKRTKVRIQAKLKDADERRRIVDEHVRLWLRELDGFALDAEDLLDLVRTRIEAVRQKQQTEAPPRQEAGDSSRKRKRRSWSDIFPSSVYGYSSSVPLWLFQRSVAKEVVKVNQKFREICDNRRDLQERRGDGLKRNDQDADRQVPRGALSDPEFVGMENDRKALKELLGASDAAPAVESMEINEGEVVLPKSHNLCVIAIKGMGGSGKTTLVQSVYGEVEGMFERRIWIYVKREYGPERITREMLESLGQKSNFINFDRLQRQLMSALSGKKLLLVLDNVDEPFLSCWNSVRPSLLSAANGSKVIVTTRSAKVPVAMSATVPQLEGLSEAEWLAMFKAKVGNFKGKPVLEAKAAKIAKKCQMSPLAAKVLGTLMANSQSPSSQDAEADNAIAEEWESVLDEMLTERESNLIQKTLAISYEQLPLHLKRCFAFCGIFPEGHDLDKDELAKCWTALGFMEGAKRPEAAGRRGFEDLVRLSFIERQIPAAGTSKATTSFRMPGLMHELARSVSKHQCLTVEKQDAVIQPSTSEATTVGLRHALLHCARMETEDEVESLLLKATQNQADRLRTFIMVHGESKVCLNRLPAGLFQRMRCLRVLDLSCTEICLVPNWVGELPLLRYLNMSNTLVSKLPDTVTSLINLQTLNLNDCYLLHDLPLETCRRLTNLRHLLLRLSKRRRSELNSTPPEIGRLTGLQSLSRFIVGEKTMGCGIDQLRNLKNIKGDLWISRLENVADAEDAAVANLADKVEIQTLTLQWTSRLESSNANRDSQQDSVAAASSTEPNPPTGGLSDHYVAVATNVIGALDPQRNLKNLSIDNYYGRTAPVWISQMQYLETLRLFHCQLWESLDILEGLPQLKHLHIERLQKLVAMKPTDSSPDKFRAIQTLTLKNLPNLEVWFFHDGQMPNLKELCFFQCPKLRVPRLILPHSVTVEIKGCSLA